MTDLFGPLQPRPNLGQGNEIGKVTKLMADSGRESMNQRKHELELADDNEGQLMPGFKRKAKSTPFSFGG